MREAYEETGLTNLVLVRFLGETTRDMSDAGRDELHQRHFYHLRCTCDPLDTWQHYESSPSDGGPPPLFEFFWACLPAEVPHLIGDRGVFLPTLLAQGTLPKPDGILPAVGQV